MGQCHRMTYIIREFGIKLNRHVNCRVVLAGEITLRVFSKLAQENIVPYPKLT